MKEYMKDWKKVCMKLKFRNSKKERSKNIIQMKDRWMNYTDKNIDVLMFKREISVLLKIICE